MEEVREVDKDDDMVQEILRAARKVRPVKNGVLVVPPNDRDWKCATGEEILRDILTETGVLPSEAKASWTGIFKRIGHSLLMVALAPFRRK